MKLPIVVLIVGLAARCVAGGWGGAYIGGETAEGKCFYEAGETMTFRLNVGGLAALPEGTWTLRWTRTGDDGVTQTGSAPVSLSEPCVVTTSLDRPGFVRIQASIDGVSDAVRFDGGAGVDFEHIVAREGEPSDFDDFWRRQLAALDNVTISPQLTEIASPKSGVKLYTLTLACAGGRPATGYLSIPDSAGPFPARLIFYGYGQSWRRPVLDPPAAKDISAKEIQLRVNAHGLELRRESAYYDAAKASVSYKSNLHGWNPADNERPDTCYFLGMVLRGVRAAQYAQTLEKWNGRDLAVEGGSQGAMQSVLVAALCPKVTSAWVCINWMCDVRGKAFGGRLASEFQPEYRPGLDYFDEVFHARRIGAGCRVDVATAGLGDYISPPTGIACFYNALRCRKRIVWRQNAEHVWRSPAPAQASFEYSSEARPGSAACAGARVLQPLGPGEVKPRGWLRDRAEAMARGYTGHADEYHADFALPWTAAFKEPRPAPHCWPYECGAYWLDGLARLAYQLDDPRLIALAKARVEPVLEGIDENSILFYTCMSRTNAVDRANFAKEPFFIRAAGQYARGLWAYYLATKDERALRAFRLAYGGGLNELNGVLSIKGVSSIMDAYAEGCRRYGNAALSPLAGMFDALFDSRQARRADWPWHDYLEFPVPGDLSFLSGKQKGRNGWAHWHGVMACETLGSLAMGTVWTGDRRYLEKSIAWYDLIHGACEQVHGAAVCDEQFARRSAYRGTETCVVAGELWDDMIFLSLSGDARFADAAERVAFNAGPVCTSRDGMRHVYFQAPNRVLTADCGQFKEGPKKGGGEYRREHFPRCCMASLNRILPIQIQHLWMKRENGLAAVMYGPNMLETSLDGAGRVMVESETDYPFGEAIRMKVSVENAAAFPLWARLPKWCRSPEVRVNGASVDTKAVEKGFVRIDRVWRTGDEVALVFPQEVSVSQGVDAEAGDAPYAAVTLGPLAMALPLEGADENTQAPGAEWQFAYDPEVFSARVVRSPVRKDFAWEAGDSPVEVFAELRDATWSHDAENPSLPASVAPGKRRTVRLVPYGSARMRVSMFPVAPR